MPYFTVTYQDSDKLRRLETRTRSKLASGLIPVLATRGRSANAVHRSLDDSVATSGVMKLYNVAKQYLNIDDIMDELTSGTGRSMSDLELLSTRSLRTGLCLNDRPPLVYYTNFLDRLNAKLHEYTILEWSPERVEQEINEILDLLMDYVEQAANYHPNYMDMDDDTFKGTLISSTWDVVNDLSLTKAIVNHRPIDTTFNQTLMLLSDYSVYPEVVKFIMTPTLGSAAVCYISDIRFPTFAHVLPPKYIDYAREIIWKTRLGIDQNVDYAPYVRKIDDSILQRFEQDAIESLDTSNFAFHGEKIRKRNEKEKETPVNLDDPAATGKHEEHMDPSTPEHNDEDSETRPKKSKGKKPNDDASDDEGESSTPSPRKRKQDPDDSNYEPDAALASLARTHTKEVQANPIAYADQDHMTRFSITNEQSTSVTQAQVRRSDYFVMSRDRYGNHMYIVTYTRKSKKPIFNPVM